MLNTKNDFKPEVTKTTTLNIMEPDKQSLQTQKEITEESYELNKIQFEKNLEVALDKVNTDKLRLDIAKKALMLIKKLNEISDALNVSMSLCLEII